MPISSTYLQFSVFLLFHIKIDYLQNNASREIILTEKLSPAILMVQQKNSYRSCRLVNESTDQQWPDRGIVKCTIDKQISQPWTI